MLCSVVAERKEEVKVRMKRRGRKPANVASPSPPPKKKRYIGRKRCVGCGKIAMKSCGNISCKPCCGKKGYCDAHMAGQFAREDRLAAKKLDVDRLDIEDGVSDDDDDDKDDDEDYILGAEDKDKEDSQPFKLCNFYDATEHDDIIDMRKGYRSIFDKEREEEKEEEEEEEKRKEKKQEKGKEKVAEPEEVCSPERVRRPSRETRQKQANDPRSRNVDREKNPRTSRDEEHQEWEKEEEEEGAEAEESDLLIYSSAEV